MIALDTNILVYAESPDDPEGRHIAALSAMEILTRGNAIIPMQVIGEFLNVCRKRQIMSPVRAVQKAADFAIVFAVPSTQIGDLTTAALLSDRHALQFFDAVILTVAKRAGATVLLSEDMQDGVEIDGVRIVNPFAAANGTLLAELFGSAL